MLAFCRSLRPCLAGVCQRVGYHIDHVLVCKRIVDVLAVAPPHDDVLRSQDAQTLRLLDSVVPIDAPVRLLHGQSDADVPWETSMRLAAALRSDAVQVTLVKTGDHRLSRPQDIALLLRTVDGLLSDMDPM